jgi:hypothetical protein
VSAALQAGLMLLAACNTNWWHDAVAQSTWNISLKGCGSVMSLPVSGAFTAHDFSAAPSCAWSSSPTVASVVRASCLQRNGYLASRTAVVV